MADDIILRDTLDRLRNTFGIDSELANVNQRLHVLVSLLGIYDSNWCLESLPVLIGSHGDVEEEAPCLGKEERASIKRWLTRLDLGYLVGSKKIEDFCAAKKKCHHLLSVFMDKIEQHHGTSKLKSNIRLLIQKQSRVKVQSSSLNLSKKKSSPSSQSCEGTTKLEERSFEEIFLSQIPRTPSKQFSSSSPSTEESDKNKTFELSNELSITPLTFVKDFEDLPYDHSNKRSSHYRRSSFDKNIIPTGRQIPNTPTHDKSVTGNTTYTIADNVKKTSSPSSDLSRSVTSPPSSQVITSNKRRRSPSNDWIRNYVLEEPESGVLWDNECNGSDLELKMSVESIDWETAFASNKTFVKDVAVSSPDNKEINENSDLSRPLRNLSLNSVTPPEKSDDKDKSTRSRRKNTPTEEIQGAQVVENPEGFESRPVRSSRRKKVSSPDFPEQHLGNEKETTEKSQTTNKNDKTKSKGRPKKSSKIVEDADSIEQETNNSATKVNRSKKSKKVVASSKKSEKENTKPATETLSCSLNKEDALAKEPSNADCRDEGVNQEQPEEGRVLRRSTRSRKTYLKSLDESLLSEISEKSSAHLESTQSRKRNTRKKKKEKITSNSDEVVREESMDLSNSSKTDVKSSHVTELNSLPKDNKQDSAFQILSEDHAQKTTLNKKASKTKKITNKS